MADQGTPYVAHLSGDCDLSRYPYIRDTLDAVPATARRIIIDLTETTVVDSTCLTELLLRKRRWDGEGRRTAVVVSSKHVYRLMSIANVIEKLRVFESADDAERYLESNAG